MTSRRVHGILGVALVLSVSVVLSGPSGVRAERYAVAAHFEPPVTINLTAETDAWAVVATAEGRTGGSVTLYRNGTFVSERNWGLQEVRFLEGGVNHRFDFSGPPFRFLVANSSLTRQWQRNWHLDVLLYSPQAILIEPDQDYWASTGRGRYVPYEELAVRVTMSGDIIATIYTQLLVPISSGAAISAQRERQYFVSFNATTWPARLIADVELKPLPADNSTLGVVLFVALVAPILIGFGVLWRRRRRARGLPEPREAPRRLRGRRNRGPSGR